MDGQLSIGPAVALDHGGRRVMLKWHKLRQAADQPPFDLANLRVGLRAGASMEVDIRCLGDGSWVCLHDERLDRETNGTGPVAAQDRDGIAGVRIANARFAPPLLEDVAQTIRAAYPTDARLQFDLKEPAASLTDDRIAGLAHALGDVAPLCRLSGYHWPTLLRVGAAVPGLALGYDPYEDALNHTLDDAADFERFTREVRATAPTATVFYLYHRFVAAALDRDVNPIAILQEGGGLVDVWTLDPAMPDFRAVLTRMLDAGADQITTNDPMAVAQLWAAWTP